MQKEELLFPLIILSVLCFGGALIVKKRWFLGWRGLTQLSLFIIGEIAFVCNRGAPCQNCPLSLGICPIGTTQRAAFIKDLPFYLAIALVFLIGLLFGSLACGWACPVGFIQDVLRSLNSTELKIPRGLNRVRGAVFFLVFLAIILELRFNFFSLRGIGMFHQFTIAAGILLLGLAIFIKRPLCRLFCPLGYIYGKLNRISLVKVRLLEGKKCTACLECVDRCIAGIKPMHEVNKDSCVKCFHCKKACPA